MTRVIRAFIAAALAGAVLAVAPGAVGPTRAAPAAPSADRLSPAVSNYTRISDGVATAGRLGDGAVGELKAAGFAAVVDLRGPDEGTDAEKRAVESAGLRYFNIPVTSQLPSGAQVVQFSHVLDDRADLPVLVHCASGNRVGAMWALYRARSGAPAATAMDEGRRIGLRGEREAAVARRSRLGALTAAAGAVAESPGRGSDRQAGATVGVRRCGCRSLLAEALAQCISSGTGVPSP